MLGPEIDYVRHRHRAGHSTPDVHEGYPPEYPGSIGEVMSTQRNADAAGLSRLEEAHDELHGVRSCINGYHHKRLPLYARPLASLLNWIQRNLDENDL